MRRGVRSVRLKGLWIHPRSGLPYHRSRRGGKTVLTPLPIGLDLDHPDFLAAFAAAARRTQAPTSDKTGSIGSGWKAFTASDLFHRKSRGYREILTREGGHILNKTRHVKLAAVQPKHISANISEASNPGARMRAWRLFGEYCRQRGWWAQNRAKDAAAPPQKRKSAHGHPAWSSDDIANFRARYAIGTVYRAIFELAYWTGARRSDVVTLGLRNVESDGVMVYIQKKTGAKSYIPWDNQLPDYAAGLAPDLKLCKEAISHMPRGLTFLTTSSGNVRSDKAVGNTLSKAAKAIGINKSIHGLRKSRAVALAEAGANPHQIGAWTGHRSLSEITHYTREMDRRKAVTGTAPERELETTAKQSGNQS